MASKPTTPAANTPVRASAAKASAKTTPTKPAKAADPQTLTGNGGETHQQATSASEQLTTDQGVPISDNQNSLKAGPRGPVLLQDFILREKICTLTTSASPSASFTPAEARLTARKSAAGA